MKFFTSRRIILYALFALMGAYFHYFPELDIGLSAFIYNHNGGFYNQDNPPFNLLLLAIKFYCALWVIILGYQSIKIFLKEGSLNPLSYPKQLYLALVFSLGPGLLIHYAIKEIFSRPRPLVTNYFGGDAEFLSAFSINHINHEAYKSFVSGHASAGFMLFAVAMLNHGTTKQIWMLCAIIAGLSFGTVRILIGYHYLSDVLFAGVFIYILSDIIAHYFRLMKWI